MRQTILQYVGYFQVPKDLNDESDYANQKRVRFLRWIRWPSIALFFFLLLFLPKMLTFVGATKEQMAVLLLWSPPLLFFGNLSLLSYFGKLGRTVGLRTSFERDLKNCGYASCANVTDGYLVKAFSACCNQGQGADHIHLAAAILVSRSRQSIEALYVYTNQQPWLLDIAPTVTNLNEAVKVAFRSTELRGDVMVQPPRIDGIDLPAWVTLVFSSIILARQRGDILQLKKLLQAI